jgi:hypothetical protein
MHCDACLPEFRTEQQVGFAAAGPKTLAKLRQSGADPAHSATARRRRAAAMRRHHRQAAASHEPTADPRVFRGEILPTIQDIPLRRLSAITGLSLRYVSLIRRGERVPHRRHWEAFASLKSR